jgi:hypothetical protein
MKIVMHRGFCDASLSFCARCSAAFFQKPFGTDRPCIVKVIDNGKESELNIVLCTDQQTLTFDLTPELQAGLALEGWEYLADFEPALIRRGAARRWRSLERGAASA